MGDRPPRGEGDPTRSWPAALTGARVMLPLTVGIVPFGLVFGVIVAQADLTAWAGGLASVVILAGASQIALVELIDQDAPWGIAVATALVINVRLAMYSAALAPAFRAFPAAWRWGLLHLITDQAAVIGLTFFERESDPVRRRWFLAGAAGSFALAWVPAPGSASPSAPASPPAGSSASRCR